MPIGRASVWVTTRTPNVGAIAPSTDSSGPSQATAHDHPAASDAVGDHGGRERDDDADADERAGDADAGVVDAEVVGGEVDRLREQRVDERRAHRRGREQTEHEQLRRVEPVGWRPPRPCAEYPPRQHTPDGPAEQPAEPGDRHAVLGRSRPARRRRGTTVRRYAVNGPSACVNANAPVPAGTPIRWSRVRTRRVRAVRAGGRRAGVRATTGGPGRRASAG